MNNRFDNNRTEFPFSIKLPQFVSFILDKLRANGFTAYIVGGAVRDALLGREALDWDITTNADVSEIESIFRDIRQFRLKHETVTLVHSEKSFEVTVMRGDDGAWSDIYNDLCHRDFTLNAMAYDDKKNVIIDPHDGAGDIKRGVVKAVDNPIDRFGEDPLRMLRAVRIAGELDFRINQSTYNAIVTSASGLARISVERIRDEFIKILLCRKPSELLELLRKTGLIENIVPELLEGYGMEQNSCHEHSVYKHILETVENTPSNTILRLAALLHDIAKPRVREKIKGVYHFYNHEGASSSMAKEIMERLRFSREEINKVSILIFQHMINYSRDWSDAAVRRLIRRAGLENIHELLILRKADIIAHGAIDNELDLLHHLEQRIDKMKSENMSLNIADLEVDGKKVMEILGLEPGPEIGIILHRLLEFVTDNPELNSEEKLTDIIKGFG